MMCLFTIYKYSILYNLYSEGFCTATIYNNNREKRNNQTWALAKIQLCWPFGPPVLSLQLCQQSWVRLLAPLDLLKFGPISFRKILCICFMYTTVYGLYPTRFAAFQNMYYSSQLVFVLPSQCGSGRHKRKFSVSIPTQNTRTIRVQKNSLWKLYPCRQRRKKK